MKEVLVDVKELECALEQVGSGRLSPNEALSRLFFESSPTMPSEETIRVMMTYGQACERAMAIFYRTADTDLRNVVVKLFASYFEKYGPNSIYQIAGRVS